MLSRYTDERILNKRVITIGIFYTLFLLFTLLKRIYLKETIGFHANYGTLEMTLKSLLEWMVIIVFLILADSLVKLMILRHLNLAMVVFTHISLSLVFGGIFSLLYQLFEVLYNPGLGLSNFSFHRAYIAFLKYYEYNFLAYFSIISLLYVFHYFQNSLNESKNLHRLEREFEKAKSKVLINQLQPHFLYNSLNSVSALIDLDPKKSKDLIADISSFLTESLKISEYKLIPLGRELDFFNSYKNILTTRFEQQLRVEMNILGKHSTILVPPLLLQPVVENVIKHGYSKDKSNILITIKIYSQDDNGIYVIITNDGELLPEGFELKSSFGFGLGNINQRLQMIYQDNFSLKLHNHIDHKKVVFELFIPKLKSISKHLITSEGTFKTAKYHIVGSN